MNLYLAFEKAAANGIDYGTIQKISKDDQGFEFFTFIDILEALDLNLIQFSKYFYEITDDEVKLYYSSIQKLRKENTVSVKKNKKKISKK